MLRRVLRRKRKIILENRKKGKLLQKLCIILDNKCTQQFQKKQTKKTQKWWSLVEKTCTPELNCYLSACRFSKKELRRDQKFP